MESATILGHVLMLSLLSMGFAQFRFDTTFDVDTGEYVAEEGSSVTMTCSPMLRGATDVSIHQITDSAISTSKTYELEEMNGSFTTTIGPLTLDDSREYLCEYYVNRCNPGCNWWRVRPFISLYVIPFMPRDDMKCSLVDGTNGIFFTGDQLILRCTGDIDDGFQVSIRYENTVVRYVELTGLENTLTGTTLIITPRIEQVLNEATIYCGYGDATDDSDGVNYCGDVRVISVFADVDVRVSPRELQIPNKGNTTLTCQSDLFSLASSSEWNIVAVGVVIGSSSMTSNERGTILTLSDIDFTGSTVGRFTVSCNVTVGTRSSSEAVTIFEEKIPTSSATSTTNPSTKQSFASITSSVTSSTLGGTGSNDGSPGGSSTTVIVIAVAVGVLLSCAALFFAIMWYREHLAREQDATTGVSGSTKQEAGVASEPQNNHQYEREIVRHHEQSAMGLDATSEFGLTEQVAGSGGTTNQPQSGDPYEIVNPQLGYWTVVTTPAGIPADVL